MDANHLLIIDVLMTDLSVNQIELRFSPKLEFSDTGTFPGQIAKKLYSFLANGLDKDKAVIGWKAKEFSLTANKIISEYEPYIRLNHKLS